MDSHGSTDRSSSFSLNGQPDRNQAVWHSQRHALPGLQWTSGGNQRTGSSFKGPVPGIPEQGEIQTGNLVPLWRAAYGTQPTRISEDPHPYSISQGGRLWLNHRFWNRFAQRSELSSTATAPCSLISTGSANSSSLTTRNTQR